MHPWDDLEQRFLRFTITVKELFKSISLAVDDDRVPANIVDMVSNIAIGADAYVSACEDEIATAMEQKIGHDYRRPTISWTVTIDDDYTIPIPDPIADSLGWKEGDSLTWRVDGDGCIIAKKVD